MNIEYAEFYITNVCNLSCNNCNRFNNFNFKGSQKWEDLKDTYSKWADILSINRISILGGEPFTNLDLPNWVKGLRKLWPNTTIFVTSNGNRLKNSHSVIEVMRANKVNLRVSIHSKDLNDSVKVELDKILVKPVQKIVEYLPHNLDAWKQTYNKIKADDWPDCNHPNDFELLPIHIQNECTEVFSFGKEYFDAFEASTTLIDDTGFLVELNWYTQFHESALKYVEGKFELLSNDPDKAISICDQKYCHTFKDGKLYKCGVSHALPDIIKQLNIPISDQDAELFEQYKPAEVKWDIKQIEKYINSLKNAETISICKFCPAEYNPLPIGDVSKKRYKHS